MKLSLLSGLLLTALVTLSCKKELQPQESSATEAQNITPNTNAVPNQGVPDPSMLQAPAVVAATAPGMNPPHGQPNHRCDIAVGAPLNSTPQAQAPQAVTAGTTQIPTPVTINPTQGKPVATAPGMNPPHGQPNHRCDIAVGAPLNSPKAASTPAPVPTQVQTPVNVAANSSAAVVTAPGMNPPHGQPNHRCDIAVGAPLDSPKAAAKAATPGVPGMLAPPATAE